MGSGEPNWKPERAYSGVSLRAVVELAGGLGEGESLGVIAGDGWYKVLPHEVVNGESEAGLVLLATAQEGASLEGDAPMLVFLTPDGSFSNEEMLQAFGPERSHYFGEDPSTTGMLVKGVSYLAVDYDGAAFAAPPSPTERRSASRPQGVLLTVVKGGVEMQYTLADLEALDVITAPGTFTRSTGEQYTATYTGIPLMTLAGNVPDGSTLRVTASDGYSMNYAVELLADRSEGTWILAYAENGRYMPLDPGYLRIVQVGPSNPEFTSSLSAQMVERIEFVGTYEDYSLRLTGVVERVFPRDELEAGIGCPCHTSTITVTSKGETHTYTGLPLWRLIAYVDDDRYPAPEQGIFYEDEHFNTDLAAAGYTIELIASDGYSQTAQSSWIAGDDRFIVAFKRDGAFLDPADDGYMRFVYDDSVELPEDVRLRSVKLLTTISLEL
jgi:DMSO/TMAO reductase YedYZ molybdopterin-dependent catalytic subunit